MSDFVWNPTVPPYDDKSDSVWNPTVSYDDKQVLYDKSAQEIVNCVNNTASSHKDDDRQK